jgi:hypothetical protein
MLFVLEAKDKGGHLIGRAEYDNAKWTRQFMRDFQAKALVDSIRVFKDEVEQLELSWAR